MTFRELIKKANGYSDPEPVEISGDDLDNATSISAHLNKLASTGHIDDRMDKLSTAIAIYMQRHPEAIEKAAKRDPDKPTYPVERFVTSTGYGAGLGAATGSGVGAVGGHALAARSAQSKMVQRDYKRMLEGKRPMTVSTPRRSAKSPGILARASKKGLIRGGLLGLGLGAGLGALAAIQNRVTHARALAGRKRMGTAMPEEVSA